MSRPFWVARVQQEKQDLDEKIDRLGAFLVGQYENRTVSDGQFHMLNHQIYYMQQYSRVLGDRVELEEVEAKSQAHKDLAS